MKTCRRGSARERNVGRRKHQRRKLRRRTWRKEEVQGGGSAGERSPAKSTGEAFVQTERGTSPSTRCRPKATGFHVDEASAQPVPIRAHEHTGLQSLWSIQPSVQMDMEHTMTQRPWEMR